VEGDLAVWLGFGALGGSVSTGRQAQRDTRHPYDLKKSSKHARRLRETAPGEAVRFNGGVRVAAK
jgi:hypothetical protein